MAVCWKLSSAGSFFTIAETRTGEDITAEGFTILDRRDYGETEIAFLTLT